MAISVEAPSANAKQALKAVANHIVKLSNVTELKDSQLQHQSPPDVLTQLRIKYQQQLIDFIDRLSDVENASDPPEPPSTELTRALATLHHICSINKQQLLKAVSASLTCSGYSKYFSTIVYISAVRHRQDSGGRH